ncbi:DUF2026 domain-containing protein [Rhodobacteraceae bacterium]|nr:DUF2026 domain-containing protein [Paracoccaceae bacterium]
MSAVIESEGGDPAYACIYYSLFGANILVDDFGVDAKVRCGLATYHLGDDHQVLCFGEVTHAGRTSNGEEFHCWVEAEGWLLDFMAPNFGTHKNTAFTARPKMFQKRFADTAGHPDEMSHAGQFFFKHNPELPETLLRQLIEHQGNQDLANLCSQWFRKTPEKMQTSVATTDQNGKIHPVTLKAVSLRSNWYAYYQCMFLTRLRGEDQSPPRDDQHVRQIFAALVREYCRRSCFPAASLEGL